MRLLLLLGLLGVAAATALVFFQRVRRPERPKTLPAHLAFGDSGSPLRAEQAFPGIAFRRPVFLCAAPGDDAHVYVVEQGGRILRVSTAAQRSDVFLDISQRVTRADNEEGLLGLAFDPDYGRTRAFYVFYNATPPRRSVVSRFRVPVGAAAADPASEEIVLEFRKPYGNHNGGMLAFGPDGYLYIGVGDGGSGGDPHGHGQNLATLLGSILRIDPHGGSPYAIPRDNPFADRRGGACPEIWAYGLRNPWRFSFAPDGRLWAGDVGQNRREEIDVIVRGGNYGWNVFEGTGRYGVKNLLARGTDMIPPVHEYDHHPVASVTGGYVYRGNDLPEYRGRYFFGDYVTGQVWTLSEEEGDASVRQVAVVPSLSSFGEDARGELYAISLGGSIYRLRARSADGDHAPERLSETGLFTDTRVLNPSPGLIAYDVRHPVWHDGASARRWIALPAGGRIGYDAEGSWTFPAGTALVMHLERDGRRLETRVLYHDEDGWAAYSYRWNAEGTDATLGAARAEHGDWFYPDAADCFACHNDPAGRVLGVRAGQLDRPFERRVSQLDRWNSLELFDRDIAREKRPAPLPERDGDAPLAERARAYLDVNCAACHRIGGFNPSQMDLRFGIPLDEMGIVDTPPREPPAGGLADRLLAPGEPERSQLWQRLHAAGAQRMPPPSRRTDPLGAELLRAWIAAR